MKALIHKMGIKTFLKLTESPENKGSSPLSGEIALPFLLISEDGKVIGYDGRKRAQALLFAGVDRMNVVIMASGIDAETEE